MFSARAQAGPIVCLYPPLSPWGPKIPHSTLCAGAVESGRACGRRGLGGHDPGASTSDLCVLGGDSYLGLGWGRALLFYWHHLGGMCCFVMHVPGPGLMRVQGPGRRLADCGSCRRVELNVTNRRNGRPVDTSRKFSS